MPDLLLELRSEEIPARMQRKAAEDLRKLLTDALVERGFVYEGAKAYATPRRLALHIVGLPAKGQDVREERKGPRVGAPDAAIQGFLKSAGLASLDQAKVESDPKKGEFYVAVIERPGRATIEVLAEILPDIIRNFPWPKSMRWGAASAQPGALRWVRPLQSIVATFGAETEEPEIVRFSVDGIDAGDVTFGHRFMAPEAIRVRRFDDYVMGLERAKVVLDADRRKDMILTEAKNLAFAQGFELIEDEGLLEEVAGLVEWPVVLMGEFDEAFLAIPPEVIRATIRANQKCFVLRRADAHTLSPSPRASGGEGLGVGGNPASHSNTPHPQSLPTASGGREARPAALANRFLLVANIEASDGGRAIAAGNGRVVRARLSDARHFWQTDLAALPDYADKADKADKPLDQRLEKLKALNIVFHEKLGTQGQRIERIGSRAKDLEHFIEVDAVLVERAARLAKADLVTEMVGEFPELQGLMGRYYAEKQGEHPSVCAAIEEHYKPLGPSDRVPTDPVSVAVALADKLDTLVGFWAIDEKPTGSKDPYALRRAVLGVIRLLIENKIRLPLNALWEGGLQLYRNQRGQDWGSAFSGSDLLSFFHDRLKVYLRDQGARHDLIDAVLALGASPSPSPRVSGGEGLGVGGNPAGDPSTPHPQSLPTASGGREAETPAPANDDLLMIVRRVEALGRFLETEDGKNLLAGVKRAANILRIEEKKDARAYDGAPDPARLIEHEEKALAAALGEARAAASAAISREDFEGAMAALARLRPAVDAFFDKVTVNADDPALRENRLNLLASLRAATREVADFNQIAG